MFSAFFIERPKFAFVISIIISIAGLVALGSLPVALYPELSPPQVQVIAIYPGADAETVSDTVAGPIESKVNGVEDMIYMSSNSANDGSYVLTVSFKVGSDPDINTVNVQNRISQATAELPEEVVRQGVTTTKQSTNMLMVVNLFAQSKLRHPVPQQLRQYQCYRFNRQGRRGRQSIYSGRSGLRHAGVAEPGEAGQLPAHHR